jgi:hypothetical protein
LGCGLVRLPHDKAASAIFSDSDPERDQTVEIVR